MSSRSTGFRWFLTAWLIAMLSDGGFATSVIPPPTDVGALLEPAPIKPTGNAATDKIITEAEAAFAAHNYDTAILRLRETLAVFGDNNKSAPYEFLYFSIGLANLLNDRNPEAEVAFSDCIKRFPKGEYTSRCYLGLGRACMLESDPQIKWRAVATLKNAAQDPRCRPFAILWLGEVYSDFGKHDEALAVYRDFIGSEVRTFQQAAVAVAVVGTLADQGRLNELEAHLGSFVRQTGVRDSLAWFANQMVVRGDELVGSQSYEAALAIYRSVPPRDEILEIQRNSLESMKKGLKVLEAKVKSEENKPVVRRSNASQLVISLKSAVEQAETALKAIEEKADLDAALLMRRGRCLFYLDRFEEALVCFETIRTKYREAKDAEMAAYAEIVTVNNLKNINEIKDRCDEFLHKFPHSDNAEQVAVLFGEVLVKIGDWKAVGVHYRGMEGKYPRSDNLDRFLFFRGCAFYENGNFTESAFQFERLLRTCPRSPLVETAHYRHAAAYLLGCGAKRALESAGAYCGKYPDGNFEPVEKSRPGEWSFKCADGPPCGKGIPDFTNALKARPENPANEPIERRIDELVRILVLPEAIAGNGYDAADKQIVMLIRNCEAGKETPNTKARIAYARARLATAFKRNDLAEIHMKERDEILKSQENHRE